MADARPALEQVVAQEPSVTVLSRDEQIAHTRTPTTVPSGSSPRWEATLTSTLGALIGATLGLTLASIATQVPPANTAAFTVPVPRIGVAVIARHCWASCLRGPCLACLAHRLLQAVHSE